MAINNKANPMTGMTILQIENAAMIRMIKKSIRYDDACAIAQKDALQSFCLLPKA
jgi:hypothetical protein